MSQTPMKVELVKRSPEELSAMYQELLKWLLEHPEYQYIETEGGFHIVISPVKLVPKSNILAPKKDIIKS